MSNILQCILVTPLWDGEISFIYNFNSGSNNISFSWKKLNNSISYPHISPHKENITLFFFPFCSFESESTFFGSSNVDVNPQNLKMPRRYGNLLSKLS